MLIKFPQQNWSDIGETIQNHYTALTEMVNNCNDAYDLLTVQKDELGERSI